MLRLVTIGFLVVAAVALIIGFIDNRPGPIYVSIVCSVLAGLVLLLFSRLNRRQTPAVASAGGPSRLSGLGPAFQSTPPSGPRLADPVPAPSIVFSPLAPLPDLQEPVEGADDRGAWSRPSWFPIENYDGLDVGDILALLTELDDDELDEVADRERQGMARATIIFRINRLLGREDDEPAVPRTAPWILERAALADAAVAVEHEPQPAEPSPVMAGSVVEMAEPLVTAEIAPAPVEAAAAPAPPPAPAPAPAKPKLTMKAAATAIKQPVPVKKAVTKQAPAAKRR